MSELERISLHVKNKSVEFEDPSYVQIKSPLPGENLWVAQVIYAHHDGEVCEFQISNESFADLLVGLWGYVRDIYK